MEENVLRTNYKPGRTIEEVERARLIERLSHTPEQRFRIMMKMIRITQKMKRAKIISNPIIP